MNYLWTTINVKNMEDAIDFYTSYAGLSVESRFPAGPDVEMAFLGDNGNVDTKIEFICNKNNKELNFGESIALGFGVKSVNEMINKFEDAGIAIHSGPVETPKFIFFGVKDPNGLTVQFFEEKE